MKDDPSMRRLVEVPNYRDLVSVALVLAPDWATARLVGAIMKGLRGMGNPAAIRKEIERQRLTKAPPSPR